MRRSSVCMRRFEFPDFERRICEKMTRMIRGIEKI
jgi:hypothetical protein